MGEATDRPRAVNVTYEWIKDQRRNAAVHEFPQAAGLAKEKGLELLMFNERHFRLRFKTNCWEIYPGKLRIQRLSESTPFIFGLPHDWTLIDVVNHAANTVKAWSDAREQAARK